MAVHIRGTYIINSDRKAVDDSYLRNIRIPNINRANKENAPGWKEQQKALYPITLDIFPSKTLEQVIQEESIEALGDYNTQHAKARNNLLKITNGQIADYILDRLSIQDLMYLNNDFTKILDEMRTKGKFNKDIFISYLKEIKDNSVKDAVDSLNTNGQLPPTKKGHERQDAENQRLIDQQAKYEAGMKRQQELLDQDGNNYIAKLNAQQQAQQRTMIAREVTRVGRFPEPQMRAEMNLIFPNIDDATYNALTKRDVLLQI